MDFANFVCLIKKAVKTFKYLSLKLLSTWQQTAGLVILSIFFLSFSGFSEKNTLSNKSVWGDVNDSLIKDKSKKAYLEMRGIIKESKSDEKGEDQVLDSATICIYSDMGPRTLLLKLFTNKKGKCDFRLPLNQKFVIEFSKDGHVTKYINVNTKIPKDHEAAYIFPFNVDIFEDIKGLDVSVLKKPIAKVAYALNKNQFDYDYGYTNKINSELKKMYKNYYFLQQIEEDANQDSDTTKTKTGNK